MKPCVRKSGGASAFCRQLDLYSEENELTVPHVDEFVNRRIKISQKMDHLKEKLFHFFPIRSLGYQPWIFN